MAIKLTTGNQVKLKSGGPWLTVTKDKPEQGSKFVEVSWFDGSALNTKILPKDALDPHPSLLENKAPEANAGQN